MPCVFHAKRPPPFDDLPSGCQFDIPETELITVDEQNWCLFHCPMITKDGNETIKTFWDDGQHQSFEKKLLERRTVALQQESTLDLTGVVFPSDVNFQKIEFPSVLFYLATFSGDAWFSEATFSGTAWFEKATFSGDAWFQSSGDVIGEEKLKANVFAHADFTVAFFGSGVSFVNRRFLQPAVFSGCTFLKAPKFHGCTIHQGSVFPPRFNFKDVTSKGAAQAYRTLKLAMEQVRARQEEAMFYGLEQESLRALSTTPRSQKVVSLLYQLTADYGESFLRPLGWLAGTTFVCWVLYVGLALGSPKPGWHLGICAEFTIEQLVRPLSAWLKSSGSDMKGLFADNFVLPFALKLLATLQAITSLSLVTLFILALRRRFKLG